VLRPGRRCPQNASANDTGNRDDGNFAGFNASTIISACELNRCGGLAVRYWQHFAVAIITFAFLHQAGAQAPQQSGDWPQWRGPLGTGAAPHGNPPTKWTDTSNIQWKVQIPGDGTSTPIIWGNQIFIQTAKPAKETAAPPVAKSPPAGDKGKGPPPGEQAKGASPGEKGKGGFGDKGKFGKGEFGGKGGKGGKGGFGGGPPPTEPIQFILMSIDRNTGKTLWQKVAREEVPHEGFRAGDGGYSCSSAMTDGQHVYAFFGSRGLYCYDLAGNLKWEKDLGDQQTRNDFGEGATPALYGNTIVVPWDHEEEDFVVALDKRTGSELWRQPRDEPTCWTTPLVVEHNGKPQVILCGTRRIRSYDLASGQQIWEHEGLTANVIPSPVTKDGVVYATSGFQGFKLFAIRLGRTGDLTGTDSILWKLDRDTPYVPSPLLSGERIYFFRSNNAVLSCHDIDSGKPHYSAQRVEGLQTVYASPVAAGGKVYLVGRNGTCVVIKDADTLEILATNVLNDPIDASPVVVGNQLLLRSRQNLYCIAEN
jgi:outer membrane protein assembly factor BamB